MPATRKVKQGGQNNKSINTSSTRSVKELIAFYESLGRDKTTKFESIIRKLKKKGYNNNDIIKFIKDHEKELDISTRVNALRSKPQTRTIEKQIKNLLNSKNYVNTNKLVNNMPNVGATEGSTVISNNSTNHNTNNNIGLEPSAEERAKLRKEKGRNNHAENNVGNLRGLYGNNTNAFVEKENVHNIAPPIREENAAKAEDFFATPNNKENVHNIAPPIREENAAKAEDFFATPNNKENVHNIAPPIREENAAKAEDFFATPNNTDKDKDKDKENVHNITPPIREENKTRVEDFLDENTQPENNSKLKACEERLKAAEAASIAAEAAATAASLKAEQAAIAVNAAEIVVEIIKTAAGEAASAANKELEQLRAEKSPAEARIKELEEALAAAEKSKKTAEDAKDKTDAALRAAETAKTAADESKLKSEEAVKATKHANASIQTNANNTNFTNVSSTISSKNLKEKNIHNNKNNSGQVEAEFPTNEFAEQTGIGSNFLSLYGIYRIQNVEDKTVVYNPVGFLKRLPTFTLYTKVEGALYLLLDQFANQFKIIMKEEDTDDRKIINIVSLRETIIRIIIHVCAYYGWLIDQNKAHQVVMTDPIIENVLTKSDRITVEDVKEHFFKDSEQETYQIIEQYIWSLFQSNKLKEMSNTMFNGSTITLEIVEHYSYSCTLEEFIEQQKFIVNEDVKSELHKIFTSARQEEVLRFYKDLVQQDLPHEKNFNLIDILYSASISPVRFTRLQELADYIDRVNGYNEEVEEQEVEEQEAQETDE